MNYKHIDQGRSPHCRIIPTCRAMVALGLSCLFAIPASAITLSVPGDYSMIQEAINAASAGDTVEIASGTFIENIVTTVPLTIQGSGPGTVISPASGVAVTLASGMDSENHSVLRNVSITGATTGISAGGYTTLEGVNSSGNASYGISLSSGTELVITNSHFDANTTGLKISSSAAFTNLAISGSTFDHNSGFGWYSGDADKAIAPDLDGVTITDTSFSDNGTVGPQGQKGFYTERLSNAVFDRVTVANNANSSDYNFGSGMEINLKWKAYTNITIRNSIFTNNGNGSLHGAGLAIKARDDAPSYSSPAAALAGVLVEDCAFSDNERHLVTGEPGKVNAGPTEVVVRRTTFRNATIPSGALVNHSLATVDAAFNYWGLDGAAASKAAVESLVTGLVNLAPWYEDFFLTILSPTPGVHPNVQVGESFSSLNERSISLRSTGRPVKGFARIENRGDTPEVLAVQTTPETRFFTLVYKSPEGNVTGRVKAGTYRTDAIDGNTRQSWLKCTISPMKNRNKRFSGLNKRFTNHIRVNSTSDAELFDEGEWRVNVKYPRSAPVRRSPR